VFDRAQPPKWFITLDGQDHAPAFRGGSSPPERVVERTTLAFLDTYVKGDSARPVTSGTTRPSPLSPPFERSLTRPRSGSETQQ
jgi:hypothetical protein